MFSEEDTARAAQVRPLNFAEDAEVTLVGHPIRGDEKREYRLPLFATFVVIVSTILLTAPKGAVLETAISVANYAEQLWSKREDSTGITSVGQGDVGINATNSNVQNVQIINNGGQVSVTSQKK